MSAGVFGERRRLQNRLPVDIQVSLDDRFRTDAIGAVFFGPADDEGIVEGHGLQEGCQDRSLHIDPPLFGCEAGDVHPMPARTDLLESQGHVAGSRDNEGVTIPIACDLALRRRRGGSDLPHFIHQLAESTPAGGIKRGGRCRSERTGGIDDHRAHPSPVWIYGLHVCRRGRKPETFLAARSIAGVSAQQAIAIPGGVGHDGHCNRCRSRRCRLELLPGISVLSEPIAGGIIICLYICPGRQHAHPRFINTEKRCEGWIRRLRGPAQCIRQMADI